MRASNLFPLRATGETKGIDNMQTASIFDQTAIPVSLSPGRARIKVPRLLRCAAEKKRIEARLSSLRQVADATPIRSPASVNTVQ